VVSDVVIDLLNVIGPEAVFMRHASTRLIPAKLSLPPCKIRSRTVPTAEEIVRSEEIDVITHVRTFVSNRLLQTPSFELYVNSDFYIDQLVFAAVKTVHASFDAVELFETHMDAIFGIQISIRGCRCPYPWIL